MVCLGFLLIRKNVDKKYYFKSKNSEINKIMIGGRHYFIIKVKTKIDVLPQSPFNMAATLQTYVRIICVKYSIPSSVYLKFVINL